jgi:hypothetical protein
MSCAGGGNEGAPLMLIAPPDCDILIHVDRRMSHLCLLGGFLVEALGVAVIAVGLWEKSEALVGYGGTALCTTGLVPFKVYYDRVTRITLVEQVKDALIRGVTLSDATTSFLQKALAG